MSKNISEVKDLIEKMKQSIDEIESLLPEIQQNTKFMEDANIVNEKINTMISNFRNENKSPINLKIK